MVWSVKCRLDSSKNFLLSVFLKTMVGWARELAQWVKELLLGLSLSQEPTWWKERANSCKVSSYGHK